MTDQNDEMLGRALRIAEDGWALVSESIYVRANRGLPIDRLPHISEEAATAKAERARAILAAIDRIDESLLPHDVALTLRSVRFRARTWAREGDWYWLVSDPLGVGFYGLFSPTSYNGGFAFSAIHQALAGLSFAEAGDLDRYLGLIADYARLVEEMRLRTLGQAERGIYMPKMQVGQAQKLVSGLKAAAKGVLTVDPARLKGLDAGDFSDRLSRRIERDVLPAYERLGAILDAAYLEKAPDAVGISQYPGGAAVYAELAKMHVTMDLTPDDLHQAGQERMARIKADMQSVRDALGFEGDEAAFNDFLNSDPRFRADTVAGVEAVFNRYIDRIDPLIDDYFSFKPKAPHGVTRLDPALEPSMTFGYYRGPSPALPKGEFNFNGANLTRQSLVNLGPLTYHELVPGHHFHLATQKENETLHPFRQESFVNAYNEGWAEYAATLAGEMGMYDDPYDRYGRLIMDAFLTSRLIVDTGMNMLGWPLEKARDYMRANTFMSEAEIQSETLRYSCDIPGQSLAYKMGDTKMMELREKMREARGNRFDIKEFHSAVLKPGALPLPDLEWHIDHVIETGKGLS